MTWDLTWTWKITTLIDGHVIDKGIRGLGKHYRIMAHCYIVNDAHNNSKLLPQQY